jgi:hypothetical protein
MQWYVLFTEKVKPGPQVQTQQFYLVMVMLIFYIVQEDPFEVTMKVKHCYSSPLQMTILILSGM